MRRSNSFIYVLPEPKLESEKDPLIRIPDYDPKRSADEFIKQHLGKAAAKPTTLQIQEIRG